MAGPGRTRIYRLAGVSLAAIVLMALTFHAAVNVVLNRYVRSRVEHAFAERMPGTSLRLGALRYEFWGDRLRCASLEVATGDRVLARIGATSLTGVHWTGFTASKKDFSALFPQAKLEVTDLSAELLTGQYRIRCGNLRVDVPGGAVILRAVGLEPAVSDDEFLAGDGFRRVRYRLGIDSCIARGVSFRELMKGQAYRAESVELRAPVFETLIDREKPPRPSTRHPVTPYEALALVEQPLHIGRFTLSDGTLRINARRFPGAQPGSLLFTGLKGSVNEIANPAAGAHTMSVEAEGRLMGAAILAVRMSVPLQPSFGLHYAGQLGAMDLTALNRYLSGASGFELKSGYTSGASFDVQVADGRARGLLKGAYEDLHVTILDRETGSEKGVTKRVATLLANKIRVRPENVPDKAGLLREGKIDYACTPEDSFLQLPWKALRTGITDLLTL